MTFNWYIILKFELYKSRHHVQAVISKLLGGPSIRRKWNKQLCNKLRLASASARDETRQTSCSGFVQWQGTQWCTMAGGLHWQASLCSSSRCQSRTHRPTELLPWTGLCHTWTTFLISLLSTMGGQKGSRQMEALLCVSHALCPCSQTQEEDQAVFWKTGPGSASGACLTFWRSWPPPWKKHKSQLQLHFFSWESWQNHL